MRRHRYLLRKNYKHAVTVDNNHRILLSIVDNKNNREEKVNNSIEALNSKFNNTADLSNSNNGILMYHVKYNKIEDLDCIILYKNTNNPYTLKQLLDMNDVQNSSGHRNRNCQIIDGIFDDKILHDGLASYGIIINLTSHDLYINAEYDKNA